MNLAAVFASAAIAAGAMSPNVFTAATSAITVKPNTEFLIALSSNPSTGYSWALSAAPNAKIVSSEGNAYQAPAKSMPGAAGQQIFAFETHGAGTATITLQYRRPWEKHPTPPPTTKTFSVTVKW